MMIAIMILIIFLESMQSLINELGLLKALPNQNSRTLTKQWKLSVWLKKIETRFDDRKKRQKRTHTKPSSVK